MYGFRERAICCQEVMKVSNASTLDVAMCEDFYKNTEQIQSYVLENLRPESRSSLENISKKNIIITTNAIKSTKETIFTRRCFLFSMIN